MMWRRSRAPAAASVSEVRSPPIICAASILLIFFRFIYFISVIICCDREGFEFLILMRVDFFFPVRCQLLWLSISVF